eukprot:maker-scaffold82_size396747-snap-gene-0.20 protein:Tk06815 transcript:maker-scaffold82_size396747-snap-gene-0.20-mRNA-1 annotation:"hypothetical protein DAPPUDRAFT_305046"
MSAEETGLLSLVPSRLRKSFEHLSAQTQHFCSSPRLAKKGDRSSRESHVQSASFSDSLSHLDALGGSAAPIEHSQPWGRRRLSTYDQPISRDDTLRRQCRRRPTPPVSQDPMGLQECDIRIVATDENLAETEVFTPQRVVLARTRSHNPTHHGLVEEGGGSMRRRHQSGLQEVKLGRKRSKTRESYHEHMQRLHSEVERPKSDEWGGKLTKWFKHITEATNLHRFPDASKKTHDRGSDVSSQNGLSLDGSGQAGSSHDLLGASGYDSGKAASRSESFNDSSSFKRDQGGLEVDESLQKKTGDGSTTHGANEPSSTSSSGQRKRLQRVEILKIAEPCPLIDPSQVVVTQGAIFLAEAVLTPIEKLRRKDIEVARALEEKQRLIAEILNVPSEDFDHIADLASQPSSDKGAREVLLAALAQAKSLSDLVNQSLNLSDEDRIAAGSEVSANLSSTRDNTPTSPMATGEPHLHTSSGGRDGTAGSDSLLSQKFHGHFPGAMSKPTEKLVSISVHLNSHLTTLLGIIQERDEERERMKRELQRSQEQVHAYLSQSTSVRTSSMSALSPGSRPASFISVEESSGTGDLSEKGAQESGEDDGARPYANLFDPSEENHPPEPVTPTNPTPTAYEVDLEGSRTPDPLSSADATDFGQSSETSPSDSDKTVTELTPTESSVVSAPDNPESGPESAPVSMEPVGETDA